MNKYIIGFSIGSILLSYYYCTYFLKGKDTLDEKGKKGKKDEKDEKDEKDDKDILDDKDEKVKDIISHILDEMIEKIEIKGKKVKFNDNWTLINN
tara:strand:+ start:499 stop:783 length:285 start_codon:yes stop_codon:yes gene_type:complete